MRRHTIEPHNLVDLELPHLKELSFLRRDGNLLILDALLEDGNPARVHRTAVDGVPAFTELRRGFQYARMLEDTTGTCTVGKESRAILLASKGHAYGVPRHRNGGVAHQAVKAQARNVQDILPPQLD